jgi:hypothetical protein
MSAAAFGPLIALVLSNMERTQATTGPMLLDTCQLSIASIITDVDVSFEYPASARHCMHQEENSE